MDQEDTWTLSDFTLPDETVRLESELPTITTGQVSNQTVFECPTCRAHNYLKNGKCIRCDYGVV